MFTKATVLSLAASTAATRIAVRQAEDKDSYASIAEQLISTYIPEDAYSTIEASVSSAAAEEGVSGDASDIIFSVMTATEAIPTWFSKAVPEELWTQVYALDQEIMSLHPTEADTTITSAAEPTTVTTTDAEGNDVTSTGFVISVTTTDDEGNTITAPVVVETEPSDEDPMPEETTIETTDDEGNTVTSTGWVAVVTTTDENGSEITSTMFATTSWDNENDGPQETTMTTTDEEGNSITSTGWAVVVTTTDDNGSETTSTMFTTDVDTETDTVTEETTTTDATETETEEVVTTTDANGAEITTSIPDNAGPTAGHARGGAAAFAAGLVGVAAFAL